MSLTQSDASTNSKNKDLLRFSNEFSLNLTSLTIFPVTYDTFIQISPDNNYIAFMRKNSLLEIFKKENNSWEQEPDKQQKITVFKKVNGINWSQDNKLILIYGISTNENKSLIKVLNKNDSTWNCELIIRERIYYASFYPDSQSIVYIRDPSNSLNIFYLYENQNLNTKKSLNKKNIKNKYLFLKFNDERSINYITNKNNILMLLPIYGRRNFDKTNRIKQLILKDYIIILVNTKVYKYFDLNTNDLDRIIPFKDIYFIVVEKEFYKFPFYIYNLNGEFLFKSEFPKPKPKLLTNPCLMYNKNHEIDFFLVQSKNGKLKVLACNEGTIKLSQIKLYYNYNKLFECIEKKKSKNKINNIYDNAYKYNSTNNYNYNNGLIINQDYFTKEDILFYEEQKVNFANENTRNNGNISENFFSKNKKDIKLVKVNPFDVEPCNNENDYLLHAEISPLKNYICFYNKNNPRYLFFGRAYQTGVFKIIKFMKDILCFKWSNQQDIVLVTFYESNIFYLITKDYYISYYLENNSCYNFNEILWSPSGKEVILSNTTTNIRLVAVLE